MPVPSTFTYTDVDTALNDVRRTIGDTDSKRPLLFDEEINAILTDESSDVIRASALSAEAIAAKFSRDGDVKLTGGLIATDRRSIAKKFADLAESLWRQAANTNSFLMPMHNVDDKKSNRDDDTITQPSFRKGYFDNTAS